jgi:hypothetical protein
MIEAETLEIAVIMRLKIGQEYLYYHWSNVKGLRALKSEKNKDPERAQKYLQEIGEKMLYRNMCDFGEYQNWGGEWKPAANIF